MLLPLLLCLGTAVTSPPPLLMPVLPEAAFLQAESPHEEGALSTDVLRVRTLAVMGTDLLLEACGPDPEALDKALDAAEKEIRRVEDLMTDWRPSPLTVLNDHAGQGPVPVVAELLDLIERGLAVGKLTGGAFDITYAGAGRLWDFKADPPVLPTEEQVKAALKNVGYGRVTVDRAAGTIELPADMRIGLGGIAKGYGVDRAMAVLLEHGIKHALVSAGGDMKVLGRKLGEPWRIAVKHPRDDERALAVLPVTNTCVMTSGDYERFFEVDGRRYHHILDPRTGYPATGCASGTIMAQDAAFADAMATALCVLGPAEGIALINRLPRVEGIAVGLDGNVLMSEGLQPPPK
ncbi:MAG: thiamine biosynthesis lipoprotein [Planctomycetota bacterium]|jgi:thiamine biosynthesis lipoprotein